VSGKALIATTGRGLVRASQADDGAWRVVSLLSDCDVRCLAVDRRSPGRVYAGTQGAGVLRSDDGGTTWQACGLGGQVVKALAASPTRAGLVYAGTRPARLFVSRDGGTTWDELDAFRRIPWRWLWLSPAERPFLGYVQAIALSPTDRERIVVGVEAGATVVSEDGGRTWTGHRRGALRDCHGLTFHASRGDWLYEAGGTGGGVAFSRDGGRTWARPEEGLDRHYAWAVAADPGRPETWYVSASPGAFQAHSERNAQACVFRHHGGRWQRLAGGLPQPLSHMPYVLITEPGAPGSLYAGLSNGDIWCSGDRGESWRRLSVNLGGIHRALVLL
jgi:photosystem II stability/assembly factor-like uncharacterized protein